MVCYRTEAVPFLGRPQYDLSIDLYLHEKIFSVLMFAQFLVLISYGLMKSLILSYFENIYELLFRVLRQI
jgi:hypothetical protein